MKNLNISLLVCLVGLVFFGAGNVAEALAQKKAVVDLPMQFRGLMPVVEVMVNGKGPFLFLVDTGAAGMLRADTTLVQRLELPKIGEDIASDTSGKNSVKIDEGRLETISIGGITALYFQLH